MPGLIAVCIVALAAGGCREPESDAAPTPRPVSVIELREMDPIQSLELTGSVKAWKEQDVAFEVGGRVEWIVESGTQLQGRWEKDGEVKVEGDQLARIDHSTYEATLESATAEVAFARVNLEHVLPAQLKRAKANLVNHTAEYERIAAISESAVKPIEPIRAKANMDMAKAQVDEAKASLDGAQAELARAQAAHTQAKLDRDRSTLFAPFAGAVSDVFVEAGGYVRAGQKVAHLVMMDPIKVDLALSPARAATLSVRDPVRIAVAGETKPVFGSVFEKATIADPETRTIRVSIIMRNQFQTFPPVGEYSEYTRIENYMRLLHERAGDASSPLMVEDNRALQKEADGYYVWAAPDRKVEDRIDPERPIITLRKIRVVPGERRMNYQGLFLFRELTDVGGLEPGTLIAMDVPDGLKDGDQVVVVRKRWQLRPGQLVPVFIGETAPKPGLYAPMNVIKPIDDHTGEVFVAADGLARQLRVQLFEHAGELVRIAAADEEDAALIAAGSRVIMDHVHFLLDREPVRIIKTVEYMP